MSRHETLSLITAIPPRRRHDQHDRSIADHAGRSRGDWRDENVKVVVRWTNAGTQVAEFAGIPATGRSFTIGGIDIYRVTNGSICEHWHAIDQLSMLGQLGLLLAPAAP